ncbi:hypothetical protein ACDZ94_24215 (plasmid) [Pseudomonas sp. UBT]|uniref:hypothetical protein n=1 Tax=Pseudomonas sp. UBT TaxID=3239198 RepID=UPI003D809EC3
MINVPLFTANTTIIRPTELNPQKTKAPQSQETIDSLPPSAPDVRPISSRSRRDLQNPTVAPRPLEASVSQFAGALVDQSDRQLAIAAGNGLIRDRLNKDKGLYGRLDTIDVPPDSTFGKAWGELADALNSEPFKSFAYAKNIDPLKLFINTSGMLSAITNNKPVDFYLERDADWAAASSAVLAAAKKLNGNAAAVAFFGPDLASPTTVARYYGIPWGNITRDDELSTIEQLLRDGTFRTLNSNDPLDAPIKQKQRAARQRIVDLSPQQLNQRLAQFAPPTAAQKVEEADQALAQLVGRGMMKLVPETSDYETSVTLQDIPEYSTFNLVRKNLLTALTGSTFSTFAQENNLDPTSVRINPVSGVLTGKVNGVNTTFTLNDVSGWTDVWGEIQNAVQQMAAGSEDDVTYPARKSARLYEVMAFYNEPPPHQEDTRRQGWQQRQLAATLARIDEMSQNKAFKALFDASPSDPASIAVQQRQQAVKQQLADTPLTASPLETLAAAVKANTSTPVETEETRADVLANAESELATTLHGTMLELKTNPTQAASKTIQPIPANSLFGQWRDYLSKALKGHGFIEWASQQNIDLTSLRYDPTSHALIAKVNGVDQRFTATDFAKKHPEHFDVLNPVLEAAAVFAAPGKPIALVNVNSNSAPFERVAIFYSISTAPGSDAFEQQTALIGRSQQFPRPPENPQKVVTWLNQQKTALGNSNDRYALIHELKNWSSESGSRRFIVDPYSDHQPKSVTTVAAFLSHKGWYPTTSKADNDNLLAALQAPVPQSPPLGNRWGFLSTQLSLSTEQRVAVAEFVKTSIGAHDNLLSYLSANVTDLSADPEQALAQLLSSGAALELASNLETEMRGAATVISLKQWLLTALVLEVDPTAGAQHKTVAGIDLMGAAYSGQSAKFIHDQFIRDLAAKKRIPANLEPVIGRLMMSGMAPQLLVKEVPNTVTLGSPEWVSFTTAVNRIEWAAPGATLGMTYQQVMNYHNINPISALEAQIQSYAQMNPLLDWAALNNDVNKDNYTLEQLKDSQVKLQAQTKATAEAISWLSQVEAPNRRSMTLKVLREELGADIDYESRFMVENEAWGVITGRHYSLAEIYEAGRLDESWIQEGHHVDFDRLRNRAKEPDFPVINNDFDNAIKQDFNLRRRHTVTLFEHMLRKLPVEERNSLLYGEVEFLNVEGAASGMVMTSVYKGLRRDFAVYPASGQIVRIADIDPSTPLGKKVSLEIDAQAFKNGTDPQQGVKSDVVLSITDQHLLDDNNEPWPLEVSFPARTETDTFSPHYASGRISKLARVMVDSTYLNKAQFLNLHRNWSSNTLETATEPSDFFKAVWHSLPGASSLEDLYHGEFLKAGVDLAIDVAIYVATEGAGKLWTLAKSGASWAAAKVSAKFIDKFGAKETESIALTDMTAAHTSESLNALSRMQGGHIAEQTADTLTPAANMADGMLSRAGERIKLTAMLQDGEWYFYNPKTMATDGPALKGFVSDTSSALRQETFSDGAQALVAEKPLTEDAYTIPRANGFDLVNEGTVYRYDSGKPNILTDLTSADHYKPLDGFEAFCPIPSVGNGRVRRGANDTCFSKVIGNVSGEPNRELQALEHVRLFPSEPKLFKKDQFVIFERRRFKMVDGEMGPQLKPVLDNKPIAYKTQIKGSIKHDPQFGLYAGQTSDALARESRVVKLNSISTMCDDKREVRGIIIDDLRAGSADKYLVIEADTAEFYYAKLNNAATGELTFTKCTPLELPLVQGYRNKLSIRQGASKTPFDANFIVLPKLDAAFKELERSGYSKSEIDELKAFSKSLTKEQQREVLYQLQRTKAIGKADIALKPIRVQALTKPAGFATWTAEQQNKFYAQQAKSNVNRDLKATGLGPSNQVRSAADQARADAANMTLNWLRHTVAPDALSYSNLVLKSGAGNCGEMALVSKDIITKSGGRAYEWTASDAHVFTVVGGPSELPAGTVDFSGPAWADAWIVDPWADIACPAREYTQKVKEVMTRWADEGLKILEGRGPISPLDKNWMNALVVKPKTPYSHGYNRT